MRRSRFNRFITVAVFGFLLTGCYTLEPVRGVAPQVGAKVAFDVNDAGRLALGSAIGPEVGQIEGRLIQRDNGDYLLGVTAVRPLRGGGEQVWKGEQVRIKPEYVGTIYERQFNTARTVVLGAATAAAIGAILSTKLLGSSNENTDRIPRDTALARHAPPILRVPIWSVPIRLPHFGRP